MEEKRKITIMYSNVQDNEPPKVIEIEDELDNYYKLLKCDNIEIVQRQVGFNTYCFVIDGCGRLKAKQRTSSMSLLDIRYGIVGNLIVTGLSDEEGNLTSLTPAQIKELNNFFIPVQGKDYKVLLQRW